MAKVRRSQNAAASPFAAPPLPSIGSPAPAPAPGETQQELLERIKEEVAQCTFVPQATKKRIADLCERAKDAPRGDSSRTSPNGNVISISEPTPRARPAYFQGINPHPPESNANTGRRDVSQARGANAAAAAADSQSSLALGQGIAASLYLIMESLLIRTASERMSLFLINERTSEMQLAVNVGVGMPRPAKGAHPPLSTGVLMSVVETKIAVNLPSVSLEDVADCPGPSKGRNALIFPVRSSGPRNSVIGCIIAVNHKRGMEPYTVDAERTLHLVSPSIAYIAKQYPIDYALFAFDPASLHRIVPLEPYQPVFSGLPTLWTVPNTQLVYHREGPEKYIRRQQMRDDATEMADEGVAEHLVSVQRYLEMMENCWKESVVQSMETDRQLKQKQALIVDAQEILHRKQRKLDLLKDVLCEQLQTSSAPPPMHIAKSQAQLKPKE